MDSDPALVLVCDAENDLHTVLRDSGCELLRCETVDEAMLAAREGGCVLVLADDYPRPSVSLDASHLSAAAEKSLRLYVEYPASLPGPELSEPQPTDRERVVVASSFFGPGLAEGTILALHGCWFLDASVELAEAHLKVARVAGYNRAVYGLPEDAKPILFELPQDVLVATSKLSGFVTGRYGPSTAWKTLWESLLRWLTRRDDLPELHWTPSVRVQAGPSEELPASAELGAFERSVRWFRNEVVYSIDQKKGAIEGFESGVDHRGRQMRRTWVRGDCTAETGMLLAWDWAVSKDPASKHLAGRILDYVWSAPDFRQSDPEIPVYGLNNWYERGPVFYGDDNARVILPTLAAGRLLGDGRWDEHVLRCLLANLRTTGPLGFRHRRLDYPASFPDGRGWQYYRDEEIVDCSPHYQAYLWAAYLWAYALTGYEGFYRGTANAIRMTVEAYPDWRWTNGITQEMARMLLPLAFLVRIEDTAEHRSWLTRIADELLAQMEPCGAIHEKLGKPDSGAYAPPASNEAYGTNEASLIQEEGDPACDLLYTANYALVGLHEAASATGDARLKDAEERLIDFLCRIQVRSEQQSYLDGAWMRGFDYELWEYWGSSADLGWGAWSVESGWTNAWIASVLAMRRLGTALFDVATGDRLKAKFPKIRDEMMQ